MAELYNESDEMVGDAIAAAGIAHLKTINVGRTNIAHGMAKGYAVAAE
jgi:hypothetical protein